MKKQLLLPGMAIVLLFGASSVLAQGFGPGDGSGGCTFVDENGDGFNDLAPDADGDGIPNGLDDDYVKPQDGTGSQMRHGQAEGAEGQVRGFAHAYMNALAFRFGLDGASPMQAGHRYGPGDGSGTAEGPADGTGFGPGGGSGDCDGTGSTATDPKGHRAGRR